MEERVEQSTRELSMLGPEAGGSGASSRVSTPAPGLPGQMLGSCEDIGGSVSGLELEELTSLEKKIKRLEKAETAAVEKVKLLETETQKLRENVDDIQNKLSKAEGELEAANSELTVYVDKVKDMSAKEVECKKFIKELEAEKNKLEDIESERDVLQERLTQQQVTISGLQASLQSSRHKLGNSSRDAETLARVMAEKEALKTDFKRLDREKGQVQIKLGEVKEKLLPLEAGDESESAEKGPGQDFDIAELREVNEKLQSQLSLARPAQLAAQKTELPLLSQKLIDEKNFEIEHLKQHLTALNTGSVSNIKHSTPNNNPAQPKVWISKLDDTSGSVENLRDATMMMRDRTST